MFPTQPWGSRAGFTTTGRYTAANPHHTGYRPESHDSDTSGVRKCGASLTSKLPYFDAMAPEPHDFSGYTIQDVLCRLHRGVAA